MRKSIYSLAALIALAGTLAAPVTAVAQSSQDSASHHRQKTKNQWRNIGIGAGAVGLYGLLKGDTGLALAGAGGAAYSASRYEHDRRSQSRIDRARRQNASARHYHRRHHHH